LFKFPDIENRLNCGKIQDKKEGISTKREGKNKTIICSKV
jgi:hypothetical protein